MVLLRKKNKLQKKITERKTKHVEEYRVAEKNYVKINEKEEENLKLVKS